jgi:hypothetical protein
MAFMSRVIGKAPEPVLNQVLVGEWVAFPGGELEGKRPKVLCSTCREAARQAGRGQEVDRVVRDRCDGIAGRALCFQCYLADINRRRAIKRAGDLNTASAARFQTTLPFEPVNRPRLEMLRVERLTARRATRATTSGMFADRRCQAQMAARHALSRIAAGIVMRGDVDHVGEVDNPDRLPKPGAIGRAREMASAIHAAELQLPESWLPFVVSR